MNTLDGIVRRKDKVELALERKFFENKKFKEPAAPKKRKVVDAGISPPKPLITFALYQNTKRSGSRSSRLLVAIISYWNCCPAAHPVVHCTGGWPRTALAWS